ncbi:hypothetical protein F2P81_013606 [Scophthalmus maximus]|uniref:Uncharacterized protein n=1 Tax=Scophthalmus maximus TaxID=52904 RepID=A0A6A4SNP6_SCOMX|nr:hypothetical protein F2P81_013606 [Scophthalmus maximus]
MVTLNVASLLAGVTRYKNTKLKTGNGNKTTARKYLRVRRKISYPLRYELHVQVCTFDMLALVVINTDETAHYNDIIAHNGDSHKLLMPSMPAFVIVEFTISFCSPAENEDCC